MREGWKTVKLQDCCIKIGSGATPRGGKEAYLEEGPFALIRSQNILDFFFSYNGLAFIDKAQADQLSNVEIKENDVLLNITGDSVARVCQVPNSLLPARVNQHVSIIRPDESKLTPEFLKYYLLNPKFKNHMLGLASVGGTRNALTKGMIEDFEIDLPPLETQWRIAAILSALDEKIELNRQTSQTLEAIAQALYKEWFVDFNFPGATGEMQESELGPIPIGWKIAKLENIVRIKHGFAFKGDYFSEEETDDILITPGNFRIGGGFNYSKFKYYDGEYPSEYILNRGDLVVTMTDLSKEGDTLGYPALVPKISGKKLLHNQRIGKVEFNMNEILKAYLYFAMCQNNYRNYVLGGATGTTVKHTSPGRICDYMLAIPTTKILRQFEEITHSLLDRIEFSFIQNQALAQNRDTLLPKLMSGEIDV